MSELKVDKITPRQGTTLTLGDSGDTINFGSGVLPNFENLTVTGDLTVDTNSLKVDSTNNFVGIGTATPSSALDIVGNIVVSGTVDGRDIATDGTKLDTIATNATANPNAIDNVVEDTTPQLGGNLELNSNDITGTGNLNITGNVSLTGTVDGRDVATDGTKLDTIATNATANPNAIDNVVEDTTPQLGGNLATNGNDINFGDNNKAVFGAGNDLRLFHDGSNSYIQDNGTGDLVIQFSDDFLVRTTANENCIRANENSSVDLYFDNSIKLQTTSSGIDVTGTITFDGGTTSADLNFGDNDKANFGAGSDLQLYHDGSNSYINETGAGILYIGGSTSINIVSNSGGNENMATFTDNGAVVLYYNNSRKFETTSTGATVTGTMTATAFSGDGSALTGISSGISWQSTVKTASFTAVSNEGYYIDTTSAVVTVTLPASPSVNDQIGLIDYAGNFATNKIIIDPNSLKIESSTALKQCETNRAALSLIYTGTTQGWVLKSSNSGGLLSGVTYNIEYLVVAGGGGGGGDYGGGGGAGGYRSSISGESSGRGASAESPISVEGGTTYTITVGGGGAGGRSNGTNGSNSVFSTITSTGGGHGTGEFAAGSNAGSGGCGGGAVYSQNGGSGTTGQGYDGGDGIGNSNPYTQGGGGGAGAAGQNAGSNFNGAGGVGVASSVTGSSVYRAGGGGAGFSSDSNSPAGAGGNGGGGAGGVNSSSAGSAGTVNTGGGGGGAGGNGAASGGAGGSGVVILRIPTSSYTGTTTGSPTVTTVGSNTILTYTGSGSYTA